MIWEAGCGRILVFVLTLVCLAGCKSLFGTQGPPDDPLFLNKKPLEAKARSSRPVAPAYSEPTPPSNPYVTDRTGVAGPPPKVAPVSGTLDPDDESQ
jgi:hypothetical protein